MHADHIFFTDLCGKLRSQFHCPTRAAAALSRQSGQNSPSILLWLDKHARRVVWLSHKGEENMHLTQKPDCKEFSGTQNILQVKICNGQTR